MPLLPNSPCRNHANVLVFNYHTCSTPRWRRWSRGARTGSIVVFDEAHNLDNICVEALSVEINAVGLKASRSLGRLQREVAR